MKQLFRLAFFVAAFAAVYPLQELNAETPRSLISVSTKGGTAWALGLETGPVAITEIWVETEGNAPRRLGIFPGSPGNLAWVPDGDRLHYRAMPLSVAMYSVSMVPKRSVPLVPSSAWESFDTGTDPSGACPERGSSNPERPRMRRMSDLLPQVKVQGQFCRALRPHSKPPPWLTARSIDGISKRRRIGTAKPRSPGMPFPRDTGSSACTGSLCWRTSERLAQWPGKPKNGPAPAGSAGTI